jgi:prepilin-type N-terminal cleavage/methylation domain-containing protein
MCHKSQGFTLVEVIVVSIIVAVLAAVAIPLYLGYVNDAAQNMANNEAANFSAAVSAGINEGATAVTCASNVYTWTMPAFFSGGTVPIYRVGRGATITVNVADMILPGKTATVTVRGKTATARW